VSPKLYSTEEAAHTLGVVPQRVRALAAHRGVGMKVGRAWVFTAADILKLKPGRIGRPAKTR
jgi:hypothetical protein